jgi:hypothetical protein
LRRDVAATYADHDRCRDDLPIAFTASADPLTSDHAVNAARCPKRSQIVTKHHRNRVATTVE